MVFFNYATMQMAAKIVYYGPGLCGKTTNLHHIYAKTSPQSRGEMVSLETETDRTLFFDLLPIDVGVIGGFKTRLQLYTVPGQVFYNTTRKLVLKGVDGIVFVADSQMPALESNVDSLRNLRENLAEIGLNLDDIPVVIQLNKRDLPNVVEPETLINALDPEHRHEHVEAIAKSGEGVFETLKVISKLTLRTLRRRMTGEEPVKPAPRKMGLGDVAQFRVRNEPEPGGAIPITASSMAGEIAGAAQQQQQQQSNDSVQTAVEEQPEDITIDAMTVEAEETATPAATAAEPPPDVRVPEPEIDFLESEKPAKAAPVKHVKVRSTIDVMAELEALRKRATQPLKQKKETAAPPKHGRELQKALNVSVPPDVLEQAHALKVTLSFYDDNGGVVGQQEQTLELGETSDVESVSVNLRIDQT